MVSEASAVVDLAGLLFVDFLAVASEAVFAVFAPCSCFDFESSEAFSVVSESLQAKENPAKHSMSPIIIFFVFTITPVGLVN